jgi:hypothetical protein|tara:strand:- start:305 stop:646 length:342 start_codon:yes stop_codon:yes gene_type:complete
MREQLITFETAKLALQKNFKEEGDYYFNKDNKLNKYRYFEFYEPEDDLLAPTQSLLQKWLREVHNIEVFVKSDYKNLVKIGFYYGGDLEYSQPTYKTYEAALEKGLQEALKLI